MLDSIIQKGQEIICDTIARECPRALLNQLSDVLQGNMRSASESAVDFCFEAASECSRVWLNQYAVPLAVAAVAVTTAVAVTCCARPRR